MGKTKYPILYIIKYITKQSSKKTLWHKLYANVQSEAVKKNSPAQSQIETSVTPAKNMVVSNNALTTTALTDPSTFFCKQFKIKQVYWSRNFIFPVLNAANPDIAAGQLLLTPRTK